ncbi:MAG: rhodanese-like domain-containing protein [Thermaurantiacus tibetensis]|uniref:rhodanese-like domain-containing protein n=1 Tax=Thermaurantiacus tibetensis TaxID=2759035 RepID=UPI00188EE38E|nr:rhodanese-like domain-containing protein [Thermaurantiacus tibetensis]
MRPSRDIDPRTLADLLARDAAIVVDVREPHEFAAGHIRGAINLPLSRFDPADLPPANGRRLVLNCAAGGRSAKALAACEAARAAVDGHLAGGIGAWKAAGLPLEVGA